MKPTSSSSEQERPDASQEAAPVVVAAPRAVSGKALAVWVAELALSAAIIFSLVVHGLELALLIVHWASLCVLLPHELLLLMRFFRTLQGMRGR